MTVLRRAKLSLPVLALGLLLVGCSAPLEAVISTPAPAPASPSPVATPAPTPSPAPTGTSLAATTCQINVTSELLRLLREGHPRTDPPPQKLTDAEHAVLEQAWEKVGEISSGGDADKIIDLVAGLCAATFNDSSLPAPSIFEPLPSFSIPVPKLTDFV
ncbi:hypothetical protein [Streptosporangium sp. KLBMP 9127]|nr:hypothetical protein [Streptosporangium sp. KLBMP 9127]